MSAIRRLATKRASREDWVPLFRDVAVAPEQTANGIDDVHSASGEIASNGTAYNVVAR
jgi:hypothetical protein